MMIGGSLSNVPGPGTEEVTRLEAQKAAAVTREDYAEAGRLQSELQEAKRLTEALQQLEVQKNAAVAREDYEVATHVKIEMDGIFEQLRGMAGEAVPQHPPAATPCPQVAGAISTPAPDARPAPVPQQVAVPRPPPQRPAEGPRTVAEEHAECPICFDSLHERAVCVLTSRGNRVCRHFFHYDCGQMMGRAVGGKVCPICRASYDDVLRVPDVREDPRAWFRVVDFDGNGALSMTEVAEVLKSTLPVDHRQLDRDLPALFRRWDPNGNGQVEYNELMGANGLFYHVRDHFRAVQGMREPPNLRVDKQAWFRYWDEDGSGSLDKDEVIRSFVKTFNFGTSIEQLDMLRMLLDALWGEFDPDMSGSIDINEFCRGGGLAEMILANLGV